jgi:hypothetical protein
MIRSNIRPITRRNEIPDILIDLEDYQHDLAIEDSQISDSFQNDHSTLVLKLDADVSNATIMAIGAAAVEWRADELNFSPKNAEGERFVRIWWD